MSDAPPPDETLPLLGDEYARRILIATRSEPMTATELATDIDAAPSTVYDRIGALEAAGFLSETTRTDGAGNHYAEYRTRLEGLALRVTPDGVELDAKYADRDEAADRLHALWGDLQ